MARAEEERDRLAEQNLTLLAVKADLKQELSRYDEGNTVDWRRDRNSLERLIADTARLSDELISVNKELKTQAKYGLVSDSIICFL